MHEWSLADAVVTAILREMEGKDPRLLEKVRILIGELQAIDREIFRFALDTLLQPYGIDAGKMSLETQKAVLACVACGRRWGMEEDPGLDEEKREAIHFLPEAAHAFIRCPSCGSPDFTMEEGRGVSIAVMKNADAPREES